MMTGREAEKEKKKVTSKTSFDCIARLAIMIEGKIHSHIQNYRPK